MPVSSLEIVDLNGRQDLKLLEQNLLRRRDDQLDNVGQRIDREHCVGAERMCPARPPACSRGAGAKRRYADAILEQVFLHALGKAVDGKLCCGINAVVIDGIGNAADGGHGGNIENVAAAGFSKYGTDSLTA